MRTNYQALIDVANAGSGSGDVTIATVRDAIDALRTASLFNDQFDSLSPRAQRYWLLTLNALEQARIWAEETADQDDTK